MKTLTACLCATLVVLSRAEAAAPAPAPCCSAPAAPPACCAGDKVTAAKPAAAPCCEAMKPAGPFTARSLYQLDATWINDTGAAVSLASLRGRPVVLAMFFASCEYACPVLVNDLKRLRAALPEALRERAQVVLVSFDTARDTPAALHAFRARMELDAHWTLLRGEEQSVQELAMLLGDDDVEQLERP